MLGVPGPANRAELERRVRMMREAVANGFLPQAQGVTVPRALVPCMPSPYPLADIPSRVETASPVLNSLAADEKLNYPTAPTVSPSSTIEWATAEQAVSHIRQMNMKRVYEPLKQEPLPSGQFSIIPQHPHVIVPLSEGPTVENPVMDIQRDSELDIFEYTGYPIVDGQPAPDSYIDTFAAHQAMLNPVGAPAALHGQALPPLMAKAKATAQVRKGKPLVGQAVVAGMARGAARAKGKKTSKFRGVSKHRLTKRWEASCWVAKKQLYLGGFDSEEKAARAYDVAALVCKGIDAPINFELSDYLHHLDVLSNYTTEELVAHIRRQSSAFSRGKSRYRGVSGQNGRWESRIGHFNGRKNVSFGVYDSEEEAAKLYDRALIIERGRTAKTNFDIKIYDDEIKQYEKMIEGFDMKDESRTAMRRCTTLPLNLPTEGEDEPKKVNVSPTLIYAEMLKEALKNK